MKAMSRNLASLSLRRCPHLFLLPPFGGFRPAASKGKCIAANSCKGQAMCGGKDGCIGRTTARVRAINVRRRSAAQSPAQVRGVRKSPARDGAEEGVCRR